MNNATHSAYIGRCSVCRAIRRVTITGRMHGSWVDCVVPGCAGKVDVARIRGIVDASVKCDGRCTHARGQSCTCECGGANHGAHHS